MHVDFVRVSAIDGKKMSIEEFQEWTYPRNHFESKVRFTRELTKGEVGCFLSHRMCWKMLLSSGEDRALILEDDVEISVHAANYLLTDDWIPSDVKICQLNSPKRLSLGRIGRDKKIIDRDIILVQPRHPTPVGAFAYIISREAAEEALRLSHRLPAPVDDFLFSPWFSFCKKYETWRTAPALVVPRQGIQSDVGDRSKKTVKKAPFLIRHGLKRVLLEREVKKFQFNSEPYTFRLWE